MQRRCVLAVLSSGVSPACKQLVHAFSTATRGSPVKRRVFVLVGQVGVGLGEEEEVDDVGVALGVE